MAKEKTKAVAKPKTGRPTKYNEDLHPKLAMLLAEKGLTIEDIATEMKVATSTVSKWLVEKPPFSEAVKIARQKADGEIERSLYELAHGYEYDVEKPMVVNGAVEIVQYRERIPPNPTAMIFWLKNRKPKEWRDRQEVTLDTTIEIKHTFDPGGI